MAVAGWRELNPARGKPKAWIVPKLNWQVFEQVLQDFAEHFQLGIDKRVILVLDQATFHTTGQLTVPEGIHLVFLPPQSPELQPAERLWPSTNEAVKLSRCVTAPTRLQNGT